MARSFVAFVCIVGASSLRPENDGQMSSTDLAPQEILSWAQKLTDSMLQMPNPTGHLSDEDAELCKNIIDMIRISMYTSLRDAHQTDQTALTEAVAAIATCNTDIVKRQSANGDIGGLENVAAGEQLTQTSLQSVYDTKKVADDAALSDLEGHMRSTSEFQQCVGVPVHRTTTAFDAFYEENMYVEEFLVKREEYRAKRAAQQLTKAALDEAARELESSTASLHAEYCAWEAVLKSACESFEECYEKTEADLSALTNSAQARGASRAEAFKTGEIIIANILYLLDQGAAPEADMEVDTSEFNLDIPSTPEMATCDQGRLTDSRWNPPISCGNEAVAPQAAGTCTCTMSIDNDIDYVYIDGVDKTSEVRGSLGTWRDPKSITFACSASTVLAVQGTDGNSASTAGCGGGGFAAKCTSTNTKSPWHDLVADTRWKVFGSQCQVSPCRYDSTHKNVVVGAPSGWYLPAFDDSAWDNAIIGSTSYAQSAVGTNFDICSPDGPAWLFRSPKFT